MRIWGWHAQLRGSRAVLVGLSGIDASGKGYLASRLARMLQARGLHGVALERGAIIFCCLSWRCTSSRGNQARNSIRNDALAGRSGRNGTDFKAF